MKKSFIGFEECWENNMMTLSKSKENSINDLLSYGNCIYVLDAEKFINELKNCERPLYLCDFENFKTYRVNYDEDGITYFEDLNELIQDLTIELRVLNRHRDLIASLLKEEDN